MRMKTLLCMSLLVMTSLWGCGNKEVVNFSESYAVDDIAAINIDNDSWQIKIMPSTDEEVRISLDGKSTKKPRVGMQDGVLNISIDGQNGDGVSQFAMGKEGELTVYIPGGLDVPVTVKNDSGDMKIDSLSVSGFMLDNSSGYVELNEVSLDMLEIFSESGDVKLDGGKAADSKIRTSSGYVTIKNVEVKDASITTKSGEVNAFGMGEETNIDVSTGSGDIGIAYGTEPENLSFYIASGSEDVSMKCGGASYIVDTVACKQGTIGEGAYNLQINSDSGTVVVR